LLTSAIRTPTSTRQVEGALPGSRVRPTTGARRSRSARAPMRAIDDPGAARAQATLRRQARSKAIRAVSMVET
jgi:hypothetical protein